MKVIIIRDKITGKIIMSIKVNIDLEEIEIIESIKEND